ncbi:MAG: MipA/OmpV family protein [Xanthomonas sp.]|uniref:MipA/OmpV family protein n=1 Tax=Pseudoxanthomonas mexicana TaxID=128785 RepID=UPI0007802FA9|nr:MipA/OmpV family protein [Pseudoxanthomonas mexicana]MBA3929955.1 MipA/OmpV family protein [Xanthomonas sp.]
MNKLLLSVLLSSLPFTAFAKGDDGDGPSGGPPRWGVGLGAMIKDSPYAGEGTSVQPIPLVSYEGDRFYFRGITAGWRFIDTDSFELGAMGKLRFDGFKVDDLGRVELARNGIDYRLLEDRDMGIDLGLGMKWKGRGGELEMELLADATGTSKGQSLSLEYGYPITLGKGQLTPKVGVTWQSKDLTNYYYGTLPEEIARGVVNYKPDAVTIPHVGVSYFRPLGEKWSVISFASYSSLPDEITDSPLLKPDTDGRASVFIGFSRGF